MYQREIDSRNTEFWDELCGSTLAQSLGITELTHQNLSRFDEAYLAFYPYLADYVLREDLENKKVLEIGLGYGTLGNLLVSQGSDYYGIDIAENPVAVMSHRLRYLGQNKANKVQRGSALEIPYKNASFDYVYTVGCLHHTGNLNKAISEVYRVLKPGGKTLIMVYHRYSFRQIVQVSLMRLRSLFYADQRKNLAQRIRALYDTNELDVAAPHTDYVSRTEAKRLFKKFSHINIDIQNFDTYFLFKGRLVPREKVLNNLARVVGLDLYITAQK